VPESTGNQHNPKVAQWFQQGLGLHQQGQLLQAKAIYERVLAVQPKHFDALHLLGVIAYQTKELALAVDLIGKATQINPNHAVAFAIQGDVLKGLEREDEALASYDRAIALKPDFAEAFNNRGNVLKALQRLDEALASFDKAIALNPDFAQAFNNRGTALIELKRLDEALASFDKALAIKPDFEYCFGQKLLSQVSICDWTNLDAQLHELSRNILDGLPVAPPFCVLALLDQPEVQLRASELYVQSQFPPRSSPVTFARKSGSEKIRIGYYSADFHNHATSYLMAELFEAHDRSRFEILGFSFGPNTQDDMRKRVSEGMDQFHEVSNRSDREIAELSRTLGIDIAVDLKGFTGHSRTGIFSETCAPIQVNYLGYPGTMAASYMDYIVADPTLIPVENHRYYTEKIVYLPDSYQVNDSKRKISERVFTRQELGLPEKSFVFCCFNNSYKIQPKTFDSWMIILESVEGSVLWLLEDNPVAAKNLRKEAELRGMDASRLVFAGRMGLAEHLARHRLADLFLDTLPYNAHTTASDALWAGLPVLTQIGHSFSARVSASLLNAIELPELITNTNEEYQSMAIDLAHNRMRLEVIKEKLNSNIISSNLFNSHVFARNIEAVFVQMIDRYKSGQKSDHVYIANSA
jgi:predicted O-linked N-acetylglucosamine transferase (SPINDLY family)